MGNALKNRLIKLACFLLAFVVVLPFQNCSQGFQVLSPEFLTLSSQVGGSGGLFDGSEQLIIEQQKSLAILSVNCKACHEDQSLGGVTKILDVEHLKSSGLIKPGNPEGSPLMIAIVQNRMPPAGAMASADKTTLQNWIRLLGRQAVLVPIPVDMVFDMGISIDPLPFRTRFQKLGFLIGSTSSPTLSKLNENRIFLGDYDFSKAIVPIKKPSF